MAETAALFDQAVRHLAAGQLAEAEGCLRAVLGGQPDHADSLAMLGIVAFQCGHAEAALSLLGQAIGLAGHVHSHHTNLGNILKALGRPEEAAACYRRALALMPDCGQTLCNLGMVLHDLGDLVQAEACLRGAIAAQADQTDAVLVLGVVLRGLGRPQDALPCFEHGLAILPDRADLHAARGNALHALGRVAEAETALRRAVQLAPDFIPARSELAELLSRDGRLAEALVHSEHVATLQPNSAEAFNAMGGILSDMGRFEAAAAAQSRAVELRPDFAQAHYNLGMVLHALGRPDQAIRHLRRALELAPAMAQVHGGMASALCGLGRYDEALAHQRRAMEIEPADVLAHRNLLAMILYHPGWTPDMQYAEHRSFEERHARPLYPQPISFPNVPDPERRLRIGYLSSDLKTHPVGRNLIPLVEAHDPKRFDLFFYAHVAEPDALGERFRAQAAGWRPIVGMGDDAVARMIREDGIDILVSLAGRFDLNRPLVAARRPAPIQVSFHDPATSGLEVMDYLIADRVLVPCHGGERFTERPIRLPSFYLHAPIADAPPVGPPPLLRNGYPTLGSFNNPAKLSDDTLALWAQILRRLPTARLRLKYREWFATPALAGRIAGIMAGHGIAADRLDLIGSRDEAGAHLARYGDIDIALDPFPFNGSTTTFEALWMGVPVVTLAGAAMVGRWTSSILAPLGLDRLIAASPEAYVDICAVLCADPAGLDRLRAGLRQSVAASPLCDARGRARQMERAYRAMWRRWCRLGNG